MNYKLLSDEELVENCRNGDCYAMEEFANRFGSLIQTAVTKSLCFSSKTEIEDTVCDVYIKILETIKNQRTIKNIRGLIMKTVYSCIIDESRRRDAVKRGNGKRDISFDNVHHLTNGNNPEKFLLRKDTIIKVRETLLRLEKYCRLLIYLRFYEEIKSIDIAKLLKEKTYNISRQLGRCMDRLRELIGN